MQKLRSRVHLTFIIWALSLQNDTKPLTLEYVGVLTFTQEPFALNQASIIVSDEPVQFLKAVSLMAAKIAELVLLLGGEFEGFCGNKKKDY